MAKKRGRPPKSKNKCKLLVTTKVEETRPYSLDIPSVALLNAIQYYVREGIIEKALTLVENKQCIPIDIIKQAAKSLSLEQYIPKEE
jgi:hypothetical protein